MEQFVIATLLGGFFSTLVITLQYLFDLADTLNVESEEDNSSYFFKVNTPYCANVFRDPKNHPWLFTDAVMVSIINYFRGELKTYRDAFGADESNELSLILYNKTHVIEKFFQETKRGKFDEVSFNEIMDVNFKDLHDEKHFLYTSVFKEAHNTLIEDLIAGKLKCSI